MQPFLAFVASFAHEPGYTHALSGAYPGMPVTRYQAEEEDMWTRHARIRGASVGKGSERCVCTLSLL